MKIISDYFICQGCNKVYHKNEAHGRGVTVALPYCSDDKACSKCFEEYIKPALRIGGSSK